MAATTNARDLEVLAQSIRADATAIQAKVSDLLTLVGRLDLPLPEKPFVCMQASCGVPFTSERWLDDHLANVHGIETETHLSRLAAGAE